MFDRFEVLMSWKLSWGLSFLLFGVNDGHIFFDLSNYCPCGFWLRWVWFPYIAIIFLWPWRWFGIHCLMKAMNMILRRIRSWWWLGRHGLIMVGWWAPLTRLRPRARPTTTTFSTYLTHCIFLPHALYFSTSHIIFLPHTLFLYHTLYFLYLTHCTIFPHTFYLMLRDSA